MTDPIAFKQPAKALEFFVQGKILSSRRHEAKHYTEVVCAAADLYSHPSKFELRSSQPLGAKDDEFKGMVRISGTVIPRTYTDKKTGEQKKITDKNVYLDVIE